MFTWMQRHKKYLIVVVWVSVISLVGALFVGWGSVNLSSSSNSVATVGKHEISIQKYQQTYQNYFNYFNSIYNDQLTQEAAEHMGIRNYVMQDLINQALLMNFADEMGIVALDSDVANILTTTPTFLNENGVFDKERYYLVLRNAGLKVSDYEESLKQLAIINKVNTMFDIPVSQKELDTFGAAYLLQDDLTLLTITVNDSEISISENETKAYWEDNKNNFLTERTYDFETIFVPASNKELSDNETKTYYEEIKYLYKDSEDKILEYDVIKDTIEKELRVKLAEEDSLRAFLEFKNGNLTSQKNITITESSQDYNIADFQTLSIDDVVMPIKRDDGYEILKLKKVTFPEPKSYEDAKIEVRNTLLAMKKAQMLDSRARARVSLFEGRDVGYVSKNTQNVGNLGNAKTSQLINKVFSSQDKYGYILVNNDEAILYRITGQALPSEEVINQNRDMLVNSIKQIRTNEISSYLSKELANRYKIVQYNF